MTAATCTICSKPLPPFPAAGPPLCGGLPCAWKYQSLAPYQRCKVCGRQLSLADQSAGTCMTGTCWATHTETQRQAREAVLAAQVAKLADALMARVPADGQQPIVLRVPAQQGRITRTPARRRDILRRRLERLLAGHEADGVKPESWADLDPARVIEPVLQAACISCRGSCCRGGGDHAYLTPATMQRARAARPHLTDDELVDVYLSHASARSYAGSCIFHQRTGCALPRELRSDTCNHFFCDPLRRFMREHDQGVNLPVVLVAADTEARRGMVVRPTYPHTDAPGTPPRTPASDRGGSA